MVGSKKTIAPGFGIVNTCKFAGMGIFRQFGNLAITIAQVPIYKTVARFNYVWDVFGANWKHLHCVHRGLKAYLGADSIFC